MFVYSKYGVCSFTFTGSCCCSLAAFGGFLAGATATASAGAATGTLTGFATAFGAGFTTAAVIFRSMNFSAFAFSSRYGKRIHGLDPVDQRRRSRVGGP